MSYQMLTLFIYWSFCITCLLSYLVSGSTILRYEVMTASALTFSIDAASNLAAFAGLLSQFPTSKWVSSNRWARFIRYVFDCRSISYSYSLSVTLPFLRMLNESIWGWSWSTIFMVHESTMQTVFSPKHRINLVSVSLSTSPQIFSGSRACWLTLMQSPSWRVKIRMRSSWCMVTIFMESSQLVMRRRGVMMKSISPSVSARAEDMIWQTGSNSGIFHPTISPFSPALSRQFL